MLGLFNLYLDLRIPDFPGVFEAHRVFWDTHLTWPFHALIQAADSGRWKTSLPGFWLTYTLVAVYVLSTIVGCRRAEQALWVLPLWVGAQLLFHASFTGILGALFFARLVTLAWPASVLILWRWLGHRLLAAWLIVICLGLGGFSVWYANNLVRRAVVAQQAFPQLFEGPIRRFNSDEPVWFSYRGLARELRRQRAR